MNWRKMLSVCGTFLLLVTMLPLGAAAATPAQQGILSKIEPLVLQELNTAGQTDYFVWMTEKADLSPAYRLPTKLEKGQFVYETLVATAARTQKDLRAYLDGQGVAYQPFYIANKILVRGGSYDLLLNIAARPDVAQITANHKFQLQEPFKNPDQGQTEAVEPNITFVKAPDVWALGITGQGTVMAGNDTGLDWDHPAIINKYRGWNGSVADHNYNWWDATGTYPNVPDDGHGHGTHTTGTMVGDDGGANQIGMAPGAQTVHCKNMDNGGSGDDGTFTECFQWDLAPWDLSGSNPMPSLAPDAINNSWGYWGGGANQFRDEIQALHAAGILVEVSAGNEGSSCGSLRSPGDYHEVMTTGSVNHASAYPGTLTGFSSRGPSALDPSPQYYFPDIMAPGENIRSSVPGGGYEGGWSGTSMSGPHATALVGLMWSANPALRGQVETTIQLIKDTAVPLTGQGGSNCGGDYTTGPNNDWGYGTIDSLAAVQAAIAIGGAGQLDGTVTDSSTSLPIEGATITADHDAGFSWSTQTNSSGYYTMTVAAGTFTVTAEAFGYIPEAVYGVVVPTDTLVTQDFALDPAPTYVVSGTVSEAGTGTPLYAQVQIVGAPVAPVWTDPGTGYYAITLPEGTYTFHVSAALHQPEDRVVVVDHDQTQDFALLTLPCILLVDDDNDSPDTRPYFTAALDNLGYDYNVFDVGGGGSNGPTLAEMQGYSIVIWFSGDKWGGSAGPNAADETALAAYLDGGGYLFLSSQDYLYDWGLTSFGQSYLGIGSYSDDTGDATTKYGVAGDPIGDGLGPYPLTYPSGFSDYGDVVNAGGGASVAFRSASSGGNNLDVDKDGGAWKTVFFGTDWVPVYNNNAANGEELLGRIIDWFGGCAGPGNGILTGQVTHELYGTPIAEATVTAQPSVEAAAIEATTDPNGHYTMTLAPGTYDVTAEKAGYTTVVVTDVVVTLGTTVLDIQLNSAAIIVDPANLHALVTPSGTTTLTLNIANPGGLDLSFAIAETTATARALDRDVIVHVPAIPARPDAASRSGARAWPERQFRMHIGNVSLAPINVLLVTPDVVAGYDISLLLNTLAAFPDLVVTLWDGNAGTPTVADMQGYDVVFVGNDILWTSSAIDKVTLSNNLADYIDADGKVLASSFVWSYDDWGFGGGRFIAEDYSPYEIATTDFWDPTTLGNFDPTHPIMAGITDVSENYNHQDPALSPNGTWVASWIDGENFVAVAPNCVGLNALYFANADFGGQAGELLHNALLYLAGGGVAPIDVPWVSEVPTQSVVPAGTELDVDVIFTAIPPYNVIGESYTATLIISHDAPVFPDDIHVPITMTVLGCMPVEDPDFDWDPTAPYIGDLVTFNGWVGAGGEPITYTWAFGDGEVGRGMIATHSYATAGTFTVTLTVENCAGAYSATVSHPVVVACPPVTDAEFDWTPITPTLGEEVTFSGSASSTLPVSFEWDFGDGIGAGQVVTHTYDMTGTYVVTMMATNDCGEYDAITHTVTVVAPPPCEEVEILAITPTIEGCSVSFAVALSGDAPFTYLWWFGDGMTSTEAMPTHVYATGTYTGTLEVWNCTAGYDTLDFAVDVSCQQYWFVYLPLIYMNAP